MSAPAIRARNIGLKFSIRSHVAPTVHSGLVRFLKRRPPAADFWALRNVSFDVPQGSVMGIIGSNGSGKSTLLRILARIYAPDEGSLSVRGKISSLITLGAGFQPNLSGIENIHYNGLLLGLTPKEVAEKLDLIVAFADIDDFIDKPVRTYSSGMRARLGFSVAIHVDPEILIVDEVLVVGDAKFRQRCIDKMTELFTQGTTVVMVQHNMDAIIQMCHTCMWLDKGRVMQIGAPYDTVKHYLEAQGLPMIELQPGMAQTMVNVPDAAP
jgi:ABC-type polysaccharide/polyol phosphate transport system ATPase subunit